MPNDCSVNDTCEAIRGYDHGFWVIFAIVIVGLIIFLVKNWNDNGDSD